MVQGNNGFKAKAGEAFDTMMSNAGPLSAIGKDERDARQDARLNQRFEAASNSSPTEQMARIILDQGKTQHINTRPLAGIGELPLDKQQGLFEANLRNKSEAAAPEIQKQAFDLVNQKGKEVQDTLTVPMANWEISGLRNLETTTGTTEKFNVKDLFDAAKLKKYIDLDPTKEGRFESGHLKDDLAENVKKLFDGIYGTSLGSKVDLLIKERLSQTGGDSDALFQAVNDAIVQNTGGAMTKAEVAELVIQAVKISMLQNPENASEVIKALKNNGQIDLAKVPNFKTVLGDVLVKYSVDQIADLNQDYFNIAAGEVNSTKVRENRQRLSNQIKNGATGTNSVKLVKNGGNIFRPTYQLTNAATFNTKISGPAIKINAKIPANTVNDSDFTQYKANPYRDLVTKIGGTNTQLKSILRLVTGAMVEDKAKAKDIFTSVTTKGLFEASDSTKGFLERSKAMLTAYKFLENVKASSTATNKLERIQNSIENLSTPEGIYKGVQEKILKDFVAKLGSQALTGALTGLNIPGLTTDIEDALKSRNLDSNLLERLSLITAGVSDPNARKELLGMIRTIAQMEVIKEIAIQSSGSDTDGKYQQTIMTLMNHFIFRGGALDASQLTVQLNDLLYKKSSSELALTLDIDSNPALKTYLQSLNPGAVVLNKLEINGQQSQGEIYRKAHMLFGIVRRGAEAGELMTLNGAAPTVIDAYLIANYGLQAGSQQLIDARSRLNSLFNATTTDGSATLYMLIEAARDGKPTDFGTQYSNILRMYRHYIENGGNLIDIMRNAESMQADSFMRAVQKQANPELGVQQGGAMTEANRVLSIEEQRSIALKEYEALSGRNGFKKMWDVVKRSLPRIGKGVALMAVSAVALAFPAAAGFVGAALAISRVASIAMTLTSGAAVIKQAWQEKNWQAGLAAGVGVAVNATVAALLPYPWAAATTLIGEALGSTIYSEASRKREKEVILNSHAAYNTAWQNMLLSLQPDTNADDKAYLTRVLNSINQTPVLGPTGNIDLTQTVTAIVAKRDAAHTSSNMTLLRSFSSIIEERTKDSGHVEQVAKANMKAKEMYESSQKNLMAYSVASSATKLGFGIARGYSKGSESGGFFGGLVGALGLHLGGESHSTSNEANFTKETSEKLTTVGRELESDFDKYAQTIGVPHDGHNVIAIIETNNGEHMAAIDLNGDPKTIEMLVPSSHIDLNHPTNVDLDFQHSELTGLSSDPATMTHMIAAYTGTSVGDVHISSTPTGYPTNVVAVIDAGNQHFAMVADSQGQIDLRHVISGPSSSWSGSAEVQTPNSNGFISGEIVAEAKTEGDSQWTLLDSLFRQAAPGHEDGWYNNKVANALNEAGADRVYEKIYSHGGSGAVSVGEKITWSDLKEIAPHTAQSAGVVTTVQNSSIVQTGNSNISGAEVLNQAQIDQSSILTLEPLDNIGHGIVVFNEDGSVAGSAGEFNFSELKDGTGGGETQEARPQNWISQEWQKFMQAISGGNSTGNSQPVAQSQQDGVGGGNSMAQTTVMPQPTQQHEGTNLTDTFTIHDRSLLDRDFKIYEDTVAKILIPQGRYEGAPSVELDPSKVDIVNVSQNGVTYIDSQGQQQFAPATNGVQLAFVGSENNPVDISAGEQTIMTRAEDVMVNVFNTASHVATTVTDTVEKTTGITAQALNQVDQNISNTGINLGQAVAGMREVTSDAGDILAAGKAIYDPGFTTAGHSIMTHAGAPGNEWVTNDTHTPAWLEAVAIKVSEGDNKVIPLDNVLKMGESFVTYRDPETNSVITVTGGEPMGVGYAFTQDSLGNSVIDVNSPYQFDFDPGTPLIPSITKAENPWWADDVKNMLPAQR